ncbi:hypothetical protein N790_13250 [Arenimonas malthae CC-JY-1]|uniref:Uncharacterized protein n=2 Tax=Arenimonas TaxID=490567 RepID=A0A091BKF8_9GAMM|nr:hypothetical protein N790_13250 [Arenimonas malthae CC-JY-1]
MVPEQAGAGTLGEPGGMDREKRLEQALRNAAALARQGDSNADYAARRFARELKQIRSAREAEGASSSDKYRVTAPDGTAYEVTAPAGATEDQVLAYAQERHSNGAAQSASATSGPWERYQRPQDKQGPWTRYQQTSGGSAIREAELADGTILEFPANTSDEVIDRTVKTYLQQGSETRAQPRGLAQETGRQLGLTARHGLEGIGNFLGIFSDPIAEAGNAALGTEGQPRPFMRAGELATWAADSMGLPQPDNGFERVVGGASRALVGAAPTLGAGGLASQAPGLTGQFGKALAASPGYQLSASASGGGASEIARESGAGPTGQMLAGLAGATAPANTSALARLATRGGEAGRQSMLANLVTFGKSGAGSPSLGQATEGRVTRGLEALLARTPGGSGVMARSGDAQQSGMGRQVRQIADSLSTRADPAQAGRAIERGVLGPNGFSANFRRTANSLYSEVDQYLPGNSGVDVSKTKAALDSLASPTPGAVNTSRALASSRVGAIRDALEADLTASSASGPFAGLGVSSRPTLPYQALKNLRTRMGDLIADSTFATDVPTKQLRQVYAALTEDMDAAARATGNPRAVQAASRANAYYRAGMNRMEVLERVIDRNGGPEKVFSAATSGTREGATTLRAVLQSLPEDGQKQLAAAVIRRMGRANPSAQDDIGEQFSSERFLTMWNSMAPEAKSALFGRLGPDYVRAMETVAKAAANQRQGAQVFRNPSQTTDAAIQAGTVFSFLTTLGTGNVGTAALIGGGVGLANLTARGLTSPTVVKWLARQTQVPFAALPVQIAQLKVEARASGDEEAIEFARELEQTVERQR